MILPKIYCNITTVEKLLQNNAKVRNFLLSSGKIGKKREKLPIKKEKLVRTFSLTFRIPIFHTSAEWLL